MFILPLSVIGDLSLEEVGILTTRIKSRTVESDSIAPHVDSPCWLWQRSKNEWGYGAIMFRNKARLVHRAMYESLVGPVGGLFVLHKCDAPACCRPDHLFIGTNDDNMKDMVAKRRHGCHVDPSYIPRGDDHWSRRKPELMARGDRNGSRTKPESRRRGEQASKKLTNQKVMEMLALRKTGLKLWQLSERFGVRESTVSRILNGVRWSHLKLNEVKS